MTDLIYRKNYEKYKRAVEKDILKIKGVVQFGNWEKSEQHENAAHPYWFSEYGLDTEKESKAIQKNGRIFTELFCTNN